MLEIYGARKRPDGVLVTYSASLSTGEENSIEWKGTALLPDDRWHALRGGCLDGVPDAQAMAVVTEQANAEVDGLDLAKLLAR